MTRHILQCLGLVALGLFVAAAGALSGGRGITPGVVSVVLGVTLLARRPRPGNPRARRLRGRS